MRKRGDCLSFGVEAEGFAALFASSGCFMRTVELAYAAGLLAEFLSMGFERNAVFAQTDTDLALRSIAATDGLHEKFLNGHLSLKEVSVAR